MNKKKLVYVVGAIILLLLLLSMTGSSGKPFKIAMQADDFIVSVKIPGAPNLASPWPTAGAGAGWEDVLVISSPSVKSGEVIEVVVRNTGGPGGFRAVAQHGNITYKTGTNKFTVDGGNTMNVDGTNWKWAVHDVWNKNTPPGLKDSVAGAEWVWNPNKCDGCDVTFKLIV
jgi:hypothetical protein